MSIDPNPPTPQTTPPASNPYPYGWRYVNRTLPDGRIEVDQVPLTLEDVLHPQEGDVIPEAPIHQIDRDYIGSVLRTRLPGLHSGLVLCDCLVNWGVEDIKNHSPDISVFEDLRSEPDLTEGIFYVERYGGRCLLALEIVSPHTRSNDVERKFEEYHAVAIPLYVIIDQLREGGPREIKAYEYAPDGWIPVPLDSRGRLPLGPPAYVWV